MHPRRFDRLVERALRGIPDAFARYLENVLITVEDEPDPELLEAHGDEELLGIYIGVPLTERRHDDVFIEPDRIIIFQRPIEEMCATPADIEREIRITVVHEVGHHFGLSDDEIEAILGP